MDCISYINDLQIEIRILKDVKAHGNCDINAVDKKIEEKENLIDKCRDNLSKLSNKNIEYRLYRYILNGFSPTQAVEKVADENYQNDIKPSSPNKIWTKYYKNLKKVIEGK